jgi:hypothetical protein
MTRFALLSPTVWDLSVRRPPSWAECGVGRQANPISAFAYRRVAHETSFYSPNRARLSLPSLPPVLMAGGAFIWNCA